MTVDRPPFYFLEKSVNILAVDDDAGVRTLITDTLKPAGVFAVQTASCGAEAERILSSSQRIHVCVLDLGLKDTAADEFHLLRRFSQRVAFVIFTGSTSPAKGFTARELGAKDIIEKSPSFDRTEFLKKISRHALLNIINPRFRTAADTLTLSTEVLFDTSPLHVSQWAIQMGITDRELRHIWRKNLGANAKIILSIYQMYSAAFAYFEKVCAAGSSKLVRIANPSAYKRLEEYFHMHRHTITDFISYGNIAAMLQPAEE